MATSDKSFLGSGLTLGTYLVIVGIVSLTFLFWGGPLWQAERTASHLWRIIGTYALIPPIAALFLRFAGTLTWSNWITASATVAAAKLMITAPLFHFMAPGTAVQLKAAEIPRETAVSIVQTPPYRAAVGGFTAGTVSGVVLLDGKPVAGAIVHVNEPAPGLALPEPQQRTLVIAKGAFLTPMGVVSTNDSLAIANNDALLHTIHMRRDGKTHANLPVPPGARRDIAIPPPGVYEIRSDTNPSTVCWLLSVDHPYVTLSDAAGAFRLADVAPSEPTLSALAVANGTLKTSNSQVELRANTLSKVTIDLSAH
ncbi:MAG: hypothetical protein R3C68_14645 [Myxococcota bacterium]